MPSNTDQNKPPYLSMLAQPPLQVVNLGLQLFADTLAARGVEVVHVDWRPPAGGDAQLADLLAQLQK